MKTCLIVFAKNPVPGQVKTRLLTHISPEQAASIYRAFLMDWCEILLELSDIDLVIASTPAGSRPVFQDMLGDAVIYIEQKGADLGIRLTAAVQWALKNSYTKILVVGSDSPTLPLSYITQAVEELDSHEIIIGPSVDGGYYLIAFSAKCVGRCGFLTALEAAVPHIFEGIAWSTQQVLQQTVERIRSMKVSFVLLPPWYDVDTYDDLFFLYTHISAMRHSGAVVRTVRTEKLLSELFSKENQEWDN